MKKGFSYKSYLLFIWAAILLIAVFLTTKTATKTKNDYYDYEIEASELALSCFNKIKEYNINNGYLGDFEYEFEKGLIGQKSYTLITTTSGNKTSKSTTINPNFAALFVNMFKECGIKENDDIVLCFSSSFPCLNICALCASEVLNLNTFIISSIGSSQYGANNPDFTFPEWMELLKNNNLIRYSADMVSFGGEYDDGSEMGYSLAYNPTGKFDKVATEIEKENIVNRIKGLGLDFYIESDFKTNIENRMMKADEKLNNIKLFVNVGGNIIGLGTNESSKYNLHGIIEYSYLTRSNTYSREYSGLIERYGLDGIKSISMINIKGICSDYLLTYDPKELITITGTENIYYDIKYNKVFPIIALVSSTVILIYTAIVNAKTNKLRRNNYE